MRGKFSNKVIFAVVLFIIVAGTAIFLLLRDRGRKQEPVDAMTAKEAPKDTLVLSEVFSASYDLESAGDLENYGTVGPFQSRSGKSSCRLSKGTEYSVTLRKPVSSIREFRNIREIQFGFFFRSDSPVKDAVAVLSIEGPDGKSVEWIGKTLPAATGSYQLAEFIYEPANEKITGDAVIKLYVWNKSGEEFYIDDLSIRIKGLVSGKALSVSYIPERNITLDFEHPVESENPDHYSAKEYHSGKRSFLLGGSASYSPSVTRRVSDVIDSELKLVTMSVWLNQQADDNEVVLVATLKDPAGKEYFWQGRSSDKGKFPPGEWVKHRAQFKLPFEQIKPEDVISVYVWNKGGREVYIDDFLVVFGETNVRSGNATVLDMTALSDSGHIFTMNTPPFRTRKISLLHPANDEDSFFPDRILPTDMICAGPVLNDPSKRDQVIRVTDDQIFVYDYCSGQKKMNRIAKVGQTTVKNYRSGSIVVAGNFVSGSTTGLLLADPVGKALLVGEFSNLKPGCSEADTRSSFSIRHQVSSSGFTSLVKESVTLALTADLDGDGLQELVLMDPGKGAFAILGFSRLVPERIAGGGESDFLAIPGFEKGFSVNVIRKVGTIRDHLVLSYYEQNEQRHRVLEYDSHSRTFTRITSAALPWVSYDCRIFSGHFHENRETLLFLNKTWKFDFKSGGVDGHRLFVDSGIDFTGFKPGFNPKFYELVTVVSGHFIDNTRTGLLVISANCLDTAYPSKPCSNFDMDSPWKPAAQLYYFKDGDN